MKRKQVTFRSGKFPMSIGKSIMLLLIGSIMPGLFTASRWKTRPGGTRLVTSLDPDLCVYACVGGAGLGVMC